MKRKPTSKFGQPLGHFVSTHERIGLPKSFCWRVIRVSDGELLGGSEKPAAAMRLYGALGGRKCGVRITGPR